MKKELPLIAIVISPMAYLLAIWNKLPLQVPMHWNFNGEINRYGNKIELLFITLVMNILMYFLFLIIPRIDPKNKIVQMGKKYFTLRLILTLFISAITFLVILSAQHKQIYFNVEMIFGLFFIALGNYMKTIRSNYFIGIRTPWTLNSETNWKKTHLLTGKIWFVSGFIIAILSLCLDKKLSIILFATITIIIVVIPVIYSYLLFKNEKQTS